MNIIKYIIVRKWPGHCGGRGVGGCRIGGIKVPWYVGGNRDAGYEDFSCTQY